MTKSSPSRIHRRNVRKLARAEAEKIGPAEARRKLAEWAARGGDIDAVVHRNGHPIRSAGTIKFNEIQDPERW